ncbi:MAG: hypothetical protein KF791_03115 [Verrucomicrobiae bacterium]|nr:hypothetical protein [Verrucomicrobiae bacterium]
MRILSRPALTPHRTAANLTAWFVLPTGSGPDPDSGPDYAVLEEALDRKEAVLHETGNVNELVIENLGDADLFIQAGDLVKGGRQDRTLGADFIVPARSGRVPIPAFCVESGRWSRRRGESEFQFSKSSDMASSKKLRALLRTRGNQGAVWESVAEMQQKLGHGVQADATSGLSPSSLQLSVEKREVVVAVEDYLRQLGAPPDPAAMGVVWAINGRLSHADVYASPVVFRKVWRKLLRAAALEALGERSGGRVPADPDPAAVTAWLATPAAAAASEEPLPPRTRITTRRMGSRLHSETVDLVDRAAPVPVHVSVLETA